MSFINELVAGITPPPIVTPDEYEGWQLKWKILVFRPALLTTEAYLLAVVLAYVAFWYWGSSKNANTAKKWLATYQPLYEQQFSTPAAKGGLVQDGYSDAFIFSTGRRNVSSLHTIFTLRPRHDFAQWAFQTGRTLIDLQYRPTDDIQLDFKLTPNALHETFVWAIVAKDELLSVTDNRWDLTFPRTTENPALPSTLVVMSEFADVTDNLLKPLGGVSLTSILSDPKIQPYFRSLSITDQPRERPTTPLAPEEREKHVILSLHAPPPSHMADLTPLLNTIFQLIDNLGKINLRPETKNKLRKGREEVDKNIKAEAEKEQKEEALDAKAAAKRKAEEERISKLSAADQKKEIEKERKRAMRKQQGKVVRK